MTTSVRVLLRPVVLVLLTLLATACRERTAASAAASGPALVLGIVPAVTPDKAREIYQPLVTELGKALGRPIELRLARDYDALGADVMAGRVHLAQVSSYLYMQTLLGGMREGHPLTVVAQEKRAKENPYVGVFIVRQDDPAKTLAELRDRRMVYVDARSSSGYHYPRMRLRDLGFDPDHFFASTAFAGSHEAVVEKVKGGEADVGAVSELTATLTGLRVVDRTAPIPEDAIVASVGIGEGELARLRSFFEQAHGRPELTGYFIARGIAHYSAPQGDTDEPREQDAE